MIIPHGFIYTSRRQDIKPSLTGLTVKTLELGFMRCYVVDTTNITIEYRVVTPAITDRYRSPPNGGTCDT
jgi:hypothetical protein